MLSDISQMNSGTVWMIADGGVPRKLIPRRLVRTAHSAQGVTAKRRSAIAEWRRLLHSRQGVSVVRIDRRSAVQLCASLSATLSFDPARMGGQRQKTLPPHMTWPHCISTLFTLPGPAIADVIPEGRPCPTTLPRG